MGPALVAYNIREDKWDELRVRLPGNLKVPQLVIALDRLYMVAARDKSAYGRRRLEIHRITDTIFTAVARKLVKLWDGYEEDPDTEGERQSPRSNVDDDIGTNAEIVTVGYVDMILIMSSPAQLRYCNLLYSEYTWGKIGWSDMQDSHRTIKIWRHLRDSQRGSEVHLSLSFIL